MSRAIQVLKLLSVSDSAVGVNAIARELGMVPSSCLHILRALADDGLVHVDAKTKQYSLGLGVLSLARRLLGLNPLTKVAQSELDALAKKHGVTVTAVELDGRDRMVVVAMAQASTLMRIDVRVGSRFPAFISATGRCVAAGASLTAAQLEQRFKALDWSNPPRFRDWLQEVEETRRTGVGVDAGRYFAGYTVVAASVQSKGEVHQAISAVGVSQQLTRRALTSLKKDLRASAMRIEAEMSASNPKP